MNRLKPQVEELEFPISYKKYNEIGREFGLNSWEREFIFPKMDNLSLCKMAEAFLANVTLYHESHFPKSTYEESLCMTFVPLLIKRIRELEKERK